MDKNRGHSITYHVARTREELKQAFSLIYKEYASRGYVSKGYKSKMRVSVYNTLPSTALFIAKKGTKVVATVTLIPDSPLGLPMDKIYKKELDVLRKKGRYIAECSQLAIDSSIFPKGWFSMFNFKKFIFVFRLFNILTDYAINAAKLTDFCIAINPKHQYLYRFIGFEEWGGLKYYGSVNMAPAIAKRLNLETFEKNLRSRRALHHVFFGQKAKPCALKGKYNLTLKDLNYFFVEKSDIFKKATKSQVKYIKSCY